MTTYDQTEVIADTLRFKKPNSTSLVEKNVKKASINVNSTTLSNDVIYGDAYLAMPDSFNDIFTNTISTTVFKIDESSYWIVDNENYVNEENKDDLEDISENRVALLAKKYEKSKFTKEDDARLMILSERLKNRFPRVNKDDYLFLNKLVDDIDEFSKIDSNMKKKYE